MTLLFINLSPIWGGGEQWTWQSAVEFKSRKYNVEVITQSDSKLARRCHDSEVSCHGLKPGRFTMTPKKQILNTFINTRDPLVIIANSGRDLTLANYIKKYNRQVRIIFRRGLDKVIANNYINRLRYKKVDQIIVNSTATRNTIRHSFPWFPPQNIHLVYNAIDSQSFCNFRSRDIRQQLHIPSTAKVFGVIGRLAKQKGHDYALEILRRLKNIYPDIYLLIVGEGEEEKSLMKKISKLNLNGQCRLVGHTDQIQSYYQAIDVVLIPSLFEGFCFTAIEAQLLERPVVAFNTSSMPEVVKHDQTGFLTPLHDSLSMSRKLQILFDKPELRRRMGQAGRKFAEYNFSASSIYNQMDKIFRAQFNGSN
jgi:glycosyltransferase involved in cell wall biosynthesis